jgi:thermostable 8-oxoguanine DNA glycosylase
MPAIFSLLYSLLCIDILGKELQTYTNSLNDWSKNTGFKFSPEKSQFIIFSHKKIKKKPIIKMDNKIIPYTKHLKILGLTFDEKLTWTTHIKKLKD